MSVEVVGVTRRFGAALALDHVDLAVRTGEFVALLGPSGSGKTTLLRILAGLDFPDAGAVRIGGRDVADVPARRRGVRFVFQHYALFRHMTVFENVAFGLRVRARHIRPSGEEISRRVHDLLNLVQLGFLADRLPSQLSGGQRQRVALARALAVEPKVLLLDEPFGALDANVRRDLRRWLRRLHDEIHLTSVFVTHDQEEAIELADRVVIINRGIVEQNGSVDDVVDRPANEFVMSFFGTVNVFRDPLRPESPVYTRPHDVEVCASPCEGTVRARVDEVRAAGAIVRIVAVGADGAPIHIEVTREEYQRLNVPKGQAVHLRPRAAKAFPGGQP